MHSVPLPDPIYAEATQVAAAIGLGVDAFVTEAVQRRIEEEKSVRLTPEQIEACERAEADVTAGRVFSAEQVRAHFASKRATSIPDLQP